MIDDDMIFNPTALRKPKLYTILAFLSAIGFTVQSLKELQTSCSCHYNSEQTSFSL